MTYTPGSPNVICAVMWPSADIGGAVHNGAHGEFAPARASSQTLICGGENVTDPAQVEPALRRGLERIRSGQPAVISVWLPRLLQKD